MHLIVITSKSTPKNTTKVVPEGSSKGARYTEVKEGKSLYEIFTTKPSPYAYYNEYKEVTGKANLINYDPKAMEEIDCRNKQLEGKFCKWLTNNLTYLIGVCVLIHILYVNITAYGTEKS
jgi:hypothetical protein